MAQETVCSDELQVLPCKKSKVPMTARLRELLSPRLHNKQSIFSSTITPPKPGEKVYRLSPGQIAKIRNMRGAVVDLHPGMGGVAPEKLIHLIKNEGVLLTSLDYMLTRGCNFECVWCFANSGPKERDFLPFALLKKITEDAAELGVRLFILTGGEPLVYRDPALGPGDGRGSHFFKVVEMIREVYKGKPFEAKILTFDDVALINRQVAERFAANGVGLCTKGDTLHAELQDFKVNQVGAFKRMQEGYQNLIDVGYGKDPKLRLVVNSVLDHTTFDGMVDLHLWVMRNGFDHSIVPIHFCGAAENEDQEEGVFSPHVFVLYHLLSRIDAKLFGMEWEPWAAFSYNKTCNRNRSGLHIRANGDITSCSESPGKTETERYTFGNIFQEGFSLKVLTRGERLKEYREEFAKGFGTYVCNPDVCDLYANDLCLGGCAVRSAYSKINYATGLIEKNPNLHNYSEHREDPLCPSWTILAIKQGILRPGLLESIHNRLLEKTKGINPADFPFLGEKAMMAHALAN